MGSEVISWFLYLDRKSQSILRPYQEYQDNSSQNILCREGPMGIFRDQWWCTIYFEFINWAHYLLFIISWFLQLQ